MVKAVATPLFLWVRFKFSGGPATRLLQQPDGGIPTCWSKTRQGHAKGSDSPLRGL